MNNIKIPKEILLEIQKNGAIIYKIDNENYYRVTNITYGDKVWKIYK
jgi:hypothetical protein